MSESIRPTKKQRELLTFIEQFISQHGYSPSYREIMAGLNYNSVATVALHVNNLIKRGHLRKRNHSARSLEVVSSTNSPIIAPVGAINSHQEKWLTQTIEEFFNQAEQTEQPSFEQLNQLETLVKALRILGPQTIHQRFEIRLQNLKNEPG